MNNIVMKVNNPKGYLTALYLAGNAFLRNVCIDINNKENEFSCHLHKDVQDGINAVFSSTSGFFPAAQIRAYSSRMLYNPFGFSTNVHLDAVYMSSEKERNDFICVAAEISELLIQKCGVGASDFMKVRVFADWVRKYFTYKNNGVYQDHSAAELLKNRTGVCQAISALACVVLPYMGLRTQYVTGEGKGAGGWGCHSWNMVFIENRWIHIDFTFGMNSIGIPMTEGMINKKIFMSTHKWDKKVFSESATETKYKLNSPFLSAKVILYLNRKYFEIDGVKIYTGTIVYYKSNNATWIKFYELVKYLGGGCEYNVGKDELQVCAANRRYSIKGASKVMDMNQQGIRKESLDAMEINSVEINEKLILHF